MIDWNDFAEMICTKSARVESDTGFWYVYRNGEIVCMAPKEDCWYPMRMSVDDLYLCFCRQEDLHLVKNKCSKRYIV